LEQIKSGKINHAIAIAEPSKGCAPSDTSPGETVPWTWIAVAPSGPARGEAVGVATKLILRPNHAKLSHGLAAEQGQAVREALRESVAAKFLFHLTFQK
jgi:hypothetical protein